MLKTGLKKSLMKRDSSNNEDLSKRDSTLALKQMMSSNLTAQGSFNKDAPMQRNLRKNQGVFKEFKL